MLSLPGYSESPPQLSLVSDAGTYGNGSDDSITIQVNGLPKPQGSKTFKGLSKSGRAILTESSTGSRHWRQDVKLDSKAQYQGPVIAGPVFLSIVFWMPRPKAHYRTGKFAGQLKPNAPMYAPTSPDLDKLIRCTLDGLQAKCGGTVFEDDSQVVALVAEKRYVTATSTCGATIHIVKKESNSQ